MENSHSLLASGRRRLARTWLSLALAGIALAYATSAQAQLAWSNVLCHNGGVECPQIGTPPFACQCGLWKDSPGSLIPNGETVYIFVKSQSEVNETAAWHTALPAPDVTHNVLQVRAAANDTSRLLIRGYNAIGAGTDWDDCSTGANLVAELQWGPADDNSVFTVKSAVYPLGTAIAGLCIHLTDDPDAIISVSRRTTAQVDFIDLVDNTGVALPRRLENFILGQ